MAKLLVYRFPNTKAKRERGDVAAVLKDDDNLGNKEDIDQFVAAGYGTEADFLSQAKTLVIDLPGLSQKEAHELLEPEVTGVDADGDLIYGRARINRLDVDGMERRTGPRATLNTKLKIRRNWNEVKGRRQRKSG